MPFHPDATHVLAQAVNAGATLITASLSGAHWRGAIAPVIASGSHEMHLVCAPDKERPAFLVIELERGELDILLEEHGAEILEIEPSPVRLSVSTGGGRARPSPSRRRPPHLYARGA